MYSHVACDVMKERTLYLLKPSSLIWHLMPYLFLFSLAMSITRGLLCDTWKVMKVNEPVHEISNNVVCATSIASDQPAHTRSLIRAFASCLSIL